MMRRYSVAGAAEALGISQAAVRARIHRGTLRTERENGTVYVWVDVEQYAEQHADLREQIEFLRDELRRKDTIIMAMTQRIPELEPAQERAEAPETTTEQPGRVETHPSSGGAQEGSERVSWWRRMFGR